MIHFTHLDPMVAVQTGAGTHPELQTTVNATMIAIVSDFEIIVEANCRRESHESHPQLGRYRQTPPLDPPRKLWQHIPYLQNPPSQGLHHQRHKYHRNQTLQVLDRDRRIPVAYVSGLGPCLRCRSPL